MEKPPMVATVTATVGASLYLSRGLGCHPSLFLKQRRRGRQAGRAVVVAAIAFEVSSSTYPTPTLKIVEKDDRSWRGAGKL